eukprot:scaffold254856_cov48-Prasinocladus_malaysianus.AAC.1
MIGTFDADPPIRSLSESKSTLRMGGRRLFSSERGRFRVQSSAEHSSSLYAMHGHYYGTLRVRAERTTAQIHRVVRVR